MLFKSIHHVAVIASDYERSKRFYVELLGFQILAEEFRQSRGSWKLDLVGPAGVQIELFTFPSPPARVDRPEACGLRHLAFSVMNVAETVQELTKLGIACEPIRIDEATGKAFTFFQDPDGLPLELYEV